MFPMEWVVDQVDAHDDAHEKAHEEAHEEAREEAREEGQENFGMFVIEIAYSLVSIRPYLGGGTGG